MPNNRYPQKLYNYRQTMIKAGLKDRDIDRFCYELIYNEKNPLYELIFNGYNPRLKDQLRTLGLRWVPEDEWRALPIKDKLELAFLLVEDIISLRESELLKVISKQLQSSGILQRESAKAMDDGYSRYFLSKRDRDPDFLSKAIDSREEADYGKVASSPI